MFPFHAMGFPTAWLGLLMSSVCAFAGASELCGKLDVRPGGSNADIPVEITVQFSTSFPTTPTVILSVNIEGNRWANPFGGVVSADPSEPETLVWQNASTLGPFVAFLSDVEPTQFKAMVGDISARGWDEDTELTLSWCAFGRDRDEPLVDDIEESVGPSLNLTRMAAESSEGVVRHDVTNFGGISTLEVNLLFSQNGMPLIVPTGYYYLDLAPPMEGITLSNVLCTAQQKDLQIVDGCLACSLLCNPAAVTRSRFEVVVVGPKDGVGALWGVWSDIDIHWYTFSTNQQDSALQKMGGQTQVVNATLSGEELEVVFPDPFPAVPVVLTTPVIVNTKPGDAATPVSYRQTVTSNIVNVTRTGFTVLLRRMCILNEDPYPSPSPEPCNDPELLVNVSGAFFFFWGGGGGGGGGFL
jgi:hypothetical protein